VASETCALCGLTYMPDNEADRVAHARRHGLILRAHNPEPEEKFLHSLLKSNGRPLFVCCASPMWMHEAVYIRSFAFAVEVPGGKIAWPEDGRTMPIECHAYLFGDDTETLPKGAIAGAGGFRSVPLENGLSRSRFEWMWLCPAVRRKGILSRQWEWLKRQNGDFDFDPITEAMQKFSQKLTLAN
jgi:zinc-finger of acetyl-transferase ESCO